MELKPGTTVREAGRAVFETIIQETALAYYHANPDAQYNTATSLTVVLSDLSHHPKGPMFITPSTSPEEACPDINYYGVCRSYCADVIYNATGFEVPGINAAGFHVDMENYAECMVYRFGHKHADFPMPNAFVTEDKEAFMEAIKKGLRPGDIILADPEGKVGHVIMFLGDALGDGHDYVTHCWPYKGGTWRWEKPENKREPEGAILLQRAEDFLYSEGSKPNWSLAAERMTDIFILRFSDHPGLLDSAFTGAGVTRYNKRGLIVKKYCSASVYDTVLPGEKVIVTETFTNGSGSDYSLDVTEYVPAGVTLTKVTGAKKPAGDVLTWTVSVPAGKTAAVSYEMKVTAKPGETVYIPGGSCDTLPTRPVRFKVGASRLTAAQEKKLLKIAEKMPGKLKTKEFEDLSFVTRFYREILGKEIELPGTADELIRAIATPRRIVKSAPRVLVPKARLSSTGKAVRAMALPRFTQGKYYMVPGDEEQNRERSLDMLVEFFTPGDILVAASGKNKRRAQDPAGIAVYIYLGGGKALSHKMTGTAVETFDETFSPMQLNNFDIVLRPGYLF
ncbi:MAG: DUF11 domain-containing protein [Clostridia bacterium]|nr:DUF11 domain-containing protein [Clostridia bacterium]